MGISFSVARCTFLASCIFFVLSIGCTGGNTRKTQLKMSSEDMYRLHCSGCHGDGTGNGHTASTLAVRPRNLQNAAWQQRVTDAHISRVIREGGVSANLSAAMPAFKEKMTDSQIEQVVRYVRRLGK